jgi:hypothetical protein
MRMQHVIHLGINHCVLHTWQNRGYTRVCGYSPRTGDPAEMLAFLGKSASGSIGIIVDVLEEEHSRDRIARLGQRDQHAMLERKLARAFPRTEFSTATVQGRTTDNPLSQDVLFSALTKPEHLRTLVEQISAAKLPLVTVCSPALLSLPVVDRLQPRSDGQTQASLLVTRDIEGRLRLAFFRNRKLVSSRLLRKSLSARPGDIARLLRQLEESVRYFDPSFIVSATNPVEVWLLGEPAAAPHEVTAAGSGHEGFHLHAVSLDNVCGALGIHSRLEPGHADLLFIELLRRHSPAANYLPLAGRRYHQLEQLRRYAQAACLVLGTTALLAGTWNGLSLLDTGLQARDLSNSLETVTAGVHTHSEYGADDNSIDPLQMRQVVSAWQALVDNRTEPREILALVSRAVEQQPRLQIDAISWSPLAVVSSTDESAPDEGSEDAPTEEDSAGEESAPDEAGIEPQLAGRIRITVRGRIEPFDNDYPLAFTEVESFMANLRADPRISTVRVREQPLDIRPGSTLTGEISRENKLAKAGFAVDIIMRTGNDQA